MRAPNNGWTDLPRTELKPWFDESHEWIGTLKPKATTRKKKK